MLMRLASLLVLAGTLLMAQVVPRTVPAQPPDASSFPPELVAQLLQAIQNDPNDLAAHEQLTQYYAAKKEGPEFVDQILWLIQNHPESQAAQLSKLVTGGPSAFTIPADYGLVKAAWESALMNGHTPAPADYNAGLFFERDDPQRGLSLFTQARTLDPANYDYVQGEVRIYLDAFNQIKRGDPDTRWAQTLEAEISQSTDAAVLTAVGNSLVADNSPSRPGMPCGNPCSSPDPMLENLGHQLLQRAETQGRWQIGPKVSPSATPGQSVRIGAQVAEANLVRKVEPVYPPLARAARVQGTVEFTVTIDQTGHVANLMLVRGHPLLISAAREAVLQWLYRPTLLNGKPVTVITNVTVNFSLSEDPAISMQPAQPPKQ